MTITLEEMILSLVSSGALISIAFALVYYFRDQLAIYFQSRLRHNFDKRLETLKDELARDRQTLQALRDGALGVRAQRQSIIDQRRVEAVDQIWAAVKELNSLRWVCKVMEPVRWPEAAEMAKTNVNVQQMFEKLAEPIANVKVMPDAHAARPYVSPLAWAWFSTMQAILAYSVAQLTVIRTGVGPDIINDQKTIAAPIIAAFPEYKELIEKYGHSTFLMIVDELEVRILNELRKSLDGREADAEEVQRASEIEKLVQEVSLQGVGDTSQMQ